MKITDEELKKIEEFAENCDEMINCKFILADSKIAKILKSIANSKELYGYMAECLLNFDFTKEFGKSKVVGFSSNSFKMPDEDYKKVALVFCFLVEVDSKNISLYDFVTKFFADENVDEYENFTKNFLLPFKIEILKHFGLYEEPVVEDGVEETEADDENLEDDEEVDTTEDVVKHLQSMLNILQISPKIKDIHKEKLSVILKGFIEAVKLNNKTLMYAMEVALTDNIKKAKPLIPMYNELLNLLIILYTY